MFLITVIIILLNYDCVWNLVPKCEIDIINAIRISYKSYITWFPVAVSFYILQCICISQRQFHIYICTFPRKSSIFGYTNFIKTCVHILQNSLSFTIGVVGEGAPCLGSHVLGIPIYIGVILECFCFKAAWCCKQEASFDSTMPADDLSVRHDLCFGTSIR